MFKKSIASKIWYSLVIGLAICCLWGVAGLFNASSVSASGTIQGSMNLDTPTSISSGTINYVNNSQTAAYTGNPINMVQSITVDSVEITNQSSGGETNYTIAYTRGGNPTEDITSVGEVAFTITGEGNFTGTLNGTFTIQKSTVYVNFDNKASDFVFDDSVHSLNTTGDGVSVSFRDANGKSIDVKTSQYTITYFNINKAIITDGFTGPGEYEVNVALLSNENVELAGSTKCEILVKSSVIKNDNGDIIINDAKGFDKDVKLQSRIITNPYTIASYAELKNEGNVQAIVQTELSKNNQLFESDNQVKLSIRTGALNFNELVLKKYNKDTQKYEKIDFTVNSSKDGIEVITNNPNGQMILVEPDASRGLSAIVIITFAVTGAALLALLILNIVLRVRGKKKEEK